MSPPIDSGNFGKIDGSLPLSANALKISFLMPSCRLYDGNVVVIASKQIPASTAFFPLVNGNRTWYIPYLDSIFIFPTPPKGIGPLISCFALCPNRNTASCLTTMSLQPLSKKTVNCSLST